MKKLTDRKLVYILNIQLKYENLALIKSIKFIIKYTDNMYIQM